MKCPQCKKSKHVVEADMPVVSNYGGRWNIRGFLCEWCAMLFVYEQDLCDLLARKRAAQRRRKK